VLRGVVRLLSGLYAISLPSYLLFTIHSTQIFSLLTTFFRTMIIDPNVVPVTEFSLYAFLTLIVLSNSISPEFSSKRYTGLALLASIPIFARLSLDFPLHLNYLDLSLLVVSLILILSPLSFTIIPPSERGLCLYSLTAWGAISSFQAVWGYFRSEVPLLGWAVGFLAIHVAQVSSAGLSVVVVNPQREPVRRGPKEIRPLEKGADQNLGKTSGSRIPTSHSRQVSEWDPSRWIGKRIYGYEVTQLIGRGGTSFVLKVTDGSKFYAMKIPQVMGKYKVNPLALSRDLSLEFSRLQDVSNKSKDVVQLFGLYADQNNLKRIVEGEIELYLDSPPAIVMEYMDGGNAKELSEDSAVFYSEEWSKIVALIALRVANALRVIHSEGYVHLDVKPQNIFFPVRPGRSGKEALNNLLRHGVKLGDLGSARRIGQPPLEYTPYYCSIDQVRALVYSRGSTPAMDVYSLGTTIYTLMTRKVYPPKEVIDSLDTAASLRGNKVEAEIYLNRAENTIRSLYRTLKPQDPKAIWEVIVEALNPDPSARPSPSDIVDRMKSSLRDLGVNS